MQHGLHWQAGDRKYFLQCARRISFLIRLPFIIISLLVLFLPATAFAHALELKSSEAEHAVLLTISYSGGEPAKYIEVNIFSPQNTDIEFQTGRTDALGRVIFAPNVPGAWRVVAADTQGHRAELIVDIASRAGALTASAIASPQASPSTPLKVVLGLSLIFNFAFLAAWLAARKKSRAL